MGRRTHTQPPLANPYANMLGDENYRRAVAAQLQQADRWPPAWALQDHRAMGPDRPPSVAEIARTALVSRRLPVTVATVERVVMAGGDRTGEDLIDALELAINDIEREHPRSGPYVPCTPAGDA